MMQQTMKTLLSAAKRYWRELIILTVLGTICFALPFLEVHNMMLTVVVVMIVVCYFMFTWACKPRPGDYDDQEEKSKRTK